MAPRRRRHVRMSAVLDEYTQPMWAVSDMQGLCPALMVTRKVALRCRRVLDSASVLGSEVRTCLEASPLPSSRRCYCSAGRSTAPASSLRRPHCAANSACALAPGPFPARVVGGWSHDVVHRFQGQVSGASACKGARRGGTGSIGWRSAARFPSLWAVGVPGAQNGSRRVLLRAAL